MCSGDEGESSADATEESEGESLWERAERLGHKSMETAEEAPAADKSPTSDEALTGDGASTGRKRSFSSSSGSSEEEPLMARKKAKRGHSD